MRKSCTQLSARACVRASARVTHAGGGHTVFRVFQARVRCARGRTWVCLCRVLRGVSSTEFGCPCLRAEPACVCVPCVFALMFVPVCVRA